MQHAKEECAELIQAINKCLRYPNKEECKNNLIEEICDVEIMLFQLKEMFGITNEAVESCKILKAKREKIRGSKKMKLLLCVLLALIINKLFL